MGFAHDNDLRSGYLEGKTVTAKDLMIEPNPPRFLREGEPSPSARSLLDHPLAHVYAGGVRAVDADELWRAYLGGVAYQDELLGEVLAALDESGTADDTIVVVTSDHGENFGWHRLLGHGQDLNDDLLRIPLVARGPGLPSGAVDTTPVSLVDLLPTLVALTGGGALPPDPGRIGAVLTGRPRVDAAERVRVVEKLPLFLDDVLDFQELAPDGELTWAWGRAGLYRGATKYVEVAGPVPPELGRRLSAPEREPRPPHHDGRASLDDPSLMAELSDLLHELRSSWPHAGEAAPSAATPDDDEELREQLRALGYLGG